ncbi:hypothetical protein FQN54_007996 [Arachnomyces sp. PD_36]|nr:hypothetical protein FQN54_007996 [Arachnomyces sp. PD_36]
MGEERKGKENIATGASDETPARQLSRVPLQVHISKLPSDTSVSFKGTSFAAGDRERHLPSPAEVRSRSNGFTYPGTPPPVRFNDLNLLVKYGRQITIAEGQCLWAIRRLLTDQVPVPEVYGWCQDGGETFIYMQLIQGETLSQQWERLTSTARSDICEQLRSIIEALRQLGQDPTDQFIGCIGRQPLLDITFSGVSDTGPFPTVQAFHDWFARLPKRGFPDLVNVLDPFRTKLPDDSPIKFTHGDLHPSNITISLGQHPRVLAIIDWHQSGWFPAYWEYCKARLTAEPDSEWNTKYIPMFLEEQRSCYDSFEFYAGSLGY